MDDFMDDVKPKGTNRTITAEKKAKPRPTDKANNEGLDTKDAFAEVGECVAPTISDKKKVVRGKSKAPPGVDERRIRTLNNYADFILDCMEPQVKNDFYVAAKDFGLETDVGIHILGLLNRLYKTGDYSSPDLEPEWSQRMVGYDTDLICQSCGRIIKDPKNLKQVFCNNMCARRGGAGKTGVMYPNPNKDHGSEEENDEKAYEREIKREGA